MPEVVSYWVTFGKQRPDCAYRLDTGFVFAPEDSQLHGNAFMGLNVKFYPSLLKAVLIVRKPAEPKMTESPWPSFLERDKG